MHGYEVGNGAVIGFLGIRRKTAAGQLLVRQMAVEALAAQRMF